MIRSSRRAAGVASAVVLLLDVLPTWLLSVTTIYGQAGSTSVYAMAGFALTWFVLAGLAIPLARSGGALLVCAALAGLARMVLQVDLGPWTQVYATSVALLGVLAWLVASAARGVGARDLAVGVAAGLAVSTVLGVALGGSPPTWHPVAGWLFVLPVVAVLVWGSGGTSAGPFAAGRSWFALGPLLGVAALVTAAPLRAAVSSTPQHPWWQLVLVVAAVVVVLNAVRGGSPRPVAGVLLVLLVALTVLPRVDPGGVHGLWPWWALVAQAGAVIALGALLAAMPVVESAPRSGGAAGGGLLVLFVGCFLFAAAQAMTMPYQPDWVPVVLALLVVGCLATGVPAPARSFSRLGPVVVVAVVLALVVCLPVVLRPLPPTPAADGAWPVRLVSYNIHVGGVSVAGRYDADRIAAMIHAQEPDVVWLSEVDRGWLVDGDHDPLPTLARRLGMRYVYAPAAAPDWGDAVLSRYPVHVQAQRRLPASGAPTGAQALALTVDVGGRRLGLVGTHLQTRDDNTTVPAVQAEVVAAMAQRLRRGGLPVVVTGDLNAAPGSRSLAALDGSLVDGLARWRPVYTAPADAPSEQIDQLYVSDDLRVSSLEVPRTTASDHLPLAVTLAAE